MTEKSSLYQVQGHKVITMPTPLTLHLLGRVVPKAPSQQATHTKLTTLKSPRSLGTITQNV